MGVFQSNPPGPPVKGRSPLNTGCFLSHALRQSWLHHMRGTTVQSLGAPHSKQFAQAYSPISPLYPRCQWSHPLLGPGWRYQVANADLGLGCCAVGECGEASEVWRRAGKNSLARHLLNVLACCACACSGASLASLRQRVGWCGFSIARGYSWLSILS